MPTEVEWIAKIDCFWRFGAVLRLPAAFKGPAFFECLAKYPWGCVRWKQYHYIKIICTDIRGIRPRESANRDFLKGSWFSEDHCYNHPKSNSLISCTPDCFSCFLMAWKHKYYHKTTISGDFYALKDRKHKKKLWFWGGWIWGDCTSDPSKPILFFGAQTSLVASRFDKNMFLMHPDTNKNCEKLRLWTLHCKCSDNDPSTRGSTP